MPRNSLYDLYEYLPKTNWGTLIKIMDEDFD